MNPIEQYRKTPRARFLDYDCGDYFITICTKNRKHYFGEIHDASMHLTSIGQYVESQLCSVSDYHNGISVPLYVVMPNHIHLIVSVRSKVSEACAEEAYSQRAPNPFNRFNPTCPRHIPVLSRYVNSLKGAVTKYARGIGADFGWQSRYHDHFIRNYQDGNKISEYIRNNVARWDLDCFNRTTK